MYHNNELGNNTTQGEVPEHPTLRSYIYAAGPTSSGSSSSESIFLSYKGEAPKVTQAINKNRFEDDTFEAGAIWGLNRAASLMALEVGETAGAAMPYHLSGPEMCLILQGVVHDIREEAKCFG